MGLRRRLFSVSRWLGSVPSLGYAVAYLLCIPLFAGIYNNLPRNFYHATIQREESTKQQGPYIRDRIEEVVVGHFKRNPTEHSYTGTSSKTDKWKINLGYIYDFEIVNDEARFVLVFLYWPREKAASSEGDFLLVNIHFKLRDDDVIDLNPLMVVELPTHTARFFPTEEDKQELKSAIVQNGIRLPVELAEKIKLYFRGLRGTGSDIEGNFWRMFYLSAVTITTVGYGDIVPLTTTSRLLVSLEAILGIVLIGLFLNSLSVERAIAQKEYDQRKWQELSKRHAVPMSPEDEAAMSKRISDNLKNDKSII